MGVRPEEFPKRLAPGSWEVLLRDLGAWGKTALAVLALSGLLCFAVESMGKESVFLPPLKPEQLERYRPPSPGEPLVFAVPNYVSLTPWNSGSWQDLGNLRVWSLRIRAPGALSLSFGFGKFRLPPGGSLLVRNPEQGILLGPFTDKDNSYHGQLWTPVLPGSSADLELRIPRDATNHVELELTSLNQGFRPLPQEVKTPSREPLLLGMTAVPGDCNVDVVCPEAGFWEQEIRSVGLLTVRGRAICSGTLLNNTSQDLSPYFLTANHCGIAPENAQSVVVYWNYQKSRCRGVQDGSLSQSTQGSFFRAGWSAQEGSDFTLLELATRPQPAFFPHWAGWDRRSLLPRGAVAIHHPQGAEKSISFDEDQLSLASASDGLGVGDPEIYLKVGAWDLGTTEPGSSGCGLWNMEHKLVGQLWGGTASCGFPQGSDYFGSLWASWEGGGTPSTRLREHLDPLGTNQETMEGRDWCVPPQVEFFVSPNPAALGEEVVFTSQVTSGVPPYRYSWDLNGDGLQDCDSPDCVFSYSYPFEGNVRLLVEDSQPCPAVVTGGMTVVDPEQGVRLVSPAEGDIVPSGSRFLVRWLAPRSAVRFKLLYSTDKGRRWRLLTDQATGSQYEWEVPIPAQNRTRSVFKIIGYDSQGNKVGSDRSEGFFSIGVIQLTTLKGGETLQSGEPYPISWITYQTIRPVQSVKILFSSNNKLTWQRLEKVTGNPGSIVVSIPPVNKKKPNCWLKVILLDSKGMPVGADTTEEPFTVLP